MLCESWNANFSWNARTIFNFAARPPAPGAPTVRCTCKIRANKWAYSAHEGVGARREKVKNQSAKEKAWKIERKSSGLPVSLWVGSAGPKRRVKNTQPNIAYANATWKIFEKCFPLSTKNCSSTHKTPKTTGILCLVARIACRHLFRLFVLLVVRPFVVLCSRVWCKPTVSRSDSAQTCTHNSNEIYMSIRWAFSPSQPQATANWLVVEQNRRVGYFGVVYVSQQCLKSFTRHNWTWW